MSNYYQDSCMNSYKIYLGEYCYYKTIIFIKINFIVLFYHVSVVTNFNKSDLVSVTPEKTTKDHCLTDNYMQFFLHFS